MTDIGRDDAAKQPTTIPIIGSADGVYDTPGEDWDGAPVRVPLDDAAEEVGYAPDQDLAGDNLNDQFGRLGQGLASIIDCAAISPTPREDSSAPSFSGVGNAHFGTALLPIGLNSGTYRRDALITLNSSGPYITYDGRNWTAQTGLGFAGAPSTIGAGLHSNGQPMAVVFAKETGQPTEFLFKSTNNGGGSWVAAGHLPASETVVAPIIGVFKGESRWVYVDRGKVYYSDDLADAEWTGGAVAFGASVNPTKFASSATECAFAIAGGNRVMRSDDGVTFAAANTGLPAGSVQDLAWSESHGLWFAAHSNGQIYSAPAGMATWTSRIATLGAVVRVIPFGRAIVHTVDDTIRVSRDLSHWYTLAPLADGAGAETEWRRGFVLNGQWWVGQVGATSTHTTVMSAMALPSEINALIGAW